MYILTTKQSYSNAEGQKLSANANANGIIMSHIQCSVFFCSSNVANDRESALGSETKLNVCLTRGHCTKLVGGNIYTLRSRMAFQKGPNVKKYIKMAFLFSTFCLLPPIIRRHSSCSRHVWQTQPRWTEVHHVPAPAPFAARPAVPITQSRPSISAVEEM